MSAKRAVCKRFRELGRALLGTESSRRRLPYPMPQEPKKPPKSPDPPHDPPTPPFSDPPDKPIHDPSPAPGQDPPPQNPQVEARTDLAPATILRSPRYLVGDRRGPVQSSHSP